MGCGTATMGSRGVTRAEHAGPMQLIVTNATSETMCEVRIASTDQPRFGDNWLTADLASGASAEMRVRTGRYHATWSTCARPGRPQFAGTATGELAFVVEQETQLFIYVADFVTPTKRAAALDRRYHIVKFPGQRVEAIGDTPRDGELDATAVVGPESRIEHAKPARFSAKDIIDPKARRSTKRVKPSLGRAHDVGAAKVGYEPR